MDKKEVVITGATRGIGYFTAQHLVARGYSVSLVARDPVRLKQAQNHLKALADGATSVRTFQADLSSIAETKGLAATLRDELPTIDILLNNAGALFTKRYETPEGHEKTLALNHYAYFTSPSSSYPSFERVKRRIISVASDAHVRGRMHWEDLNLQKSYGFGGRSAYCQSKLANVLFVRELSRRLGTERIARASLHPGFVSSHFGKDEKSWMRLFMAITRPLQRSVPEGASTLIWAATSPEANDLCGDYLKDSKISAPSSRAQSRECAQRLWEHSLSVCGYTECPI